MNRARQSAVSDWWWTTDRVALVAIIALFAIGLVLAFAASPAATGGPYSDGVDIARGVSAPLQTGPERGGWVADSFGALYPWGQVLGGPVSPTKSGPYWPNFEIARGITSFPNGLAGLEVDGYGGLHPFASPGLP